MSSTAATPKPASPLSRFARPILYLTLGGFLAFAAVRYWQTEQETQTDPAFEKRIVSGYGLGDGIHHSLDPAFKDANGDLLADTPTDASKLLDPPSITVDHIISDDGDSEPIAWDALNALIASSAGKPTSGHAFDDARGEFEPIRSGNLQVLIVHAADTPYLVNHFGFIPFAVAGDERGLHGHRMDLIVPASSKEIHTPDDIRGHTLLCTQPLSVVGYRAALAYLNQTIKMRPDFDYKIIMSLDQRESIMRISKGQAEVAAVSSDKLKSMLKAGDITLDSYKTIYESDVVPQYAVGYFYNLKPELADKIQRAVLSFVNSAPGEKAHPVRFVKIDYAKDFATVRTIDDAFDSRLLMPPKSSAHPATQPVAATAPAQP